MKSKGNLQNDKLEASKMYGNFNSKINKIEKELDYFKLEN
jgi:hypothetical protein